MNHLASKGARSFSWSNVGAETSAIAANASPTYNLAHGLRSIFKGSAFLPAFVIDGFYAMLDESGFEFVRQCLAVIEDKGIREQGIYRNCGVTSKVQKLMQLALDKRKASSNSAATGGEYRGLNLLDDSECEIRTISSAVKTFLRNLPEPLMTFELHNQFINAAKMGDRQQRVNHIHYYVYKLPESHRVMLEMIIRHLRRVADLSNENLMTVGNLGVCFGPTLLRPKEETMAAIMDIKFCNVVVEVLIANCHQVFDTKPSQQQIGHPCPPKPSHNLVAVMPNESGCNKLLPVDVASIGSSVGDLSMGGGRDLQSSVCGGSAIVPLSGAPSLGTPPPSRPRSIASSSSSSAAANNHNHPVLLPSATALRNSRRQQQPPPPIPSNNGRGTTMAQFGQYQQHTLPAQTFETHQSSEELGLAQQHHPSSQILQNPQYVQSQSVVLPSTSFARQQQCSSASLNSSPQRASIRAAAEAMASAVADNSSDNSLNSIGSVETTDRSPSSLPPPTGGGGSGVGLPPVRSKLSGSYAPAYNPFALENLSNRLQKRHSNGNLLSSSFSVHSNLGGYYPPPQLHHQQSSSIAEYASATLPHPSAAAKYHPMQMQPNVVCPPSSSAYGQSTAPRIPQAYSSFINPNVQFQPSRRVRTLYPCAAGHETELSFEPGQIITNVYESKEDGWLVGTLNGKTGLIPANYVDII